MGEKEQAKCPDPNYEQVRMDNMGKVQNSIIEIIADAKLPTQDVLMVLRVTQRQVEDIFMTQLKARSTQAKREDSNGEAESQEEEGRCGGKLPAGPPTDCGPVVPKIGPPAKAPIDIPRRKSPKTGRANNGG